jgi:elongation factor P
MLYIAKEEYFMISSNEMKKGLTLDIEGEPYIVLEWQHVEKGRESANIRMKLRHLRTGAIIERTLDAGHKFRLVPIERHPVTFMYWDGESYHFVALDTSPDPDSEDEIILPPEMLGDARKYIVDNLQLDLLLLNDEPVGVELPASVVMRVKETDPVVSADSHYKHAWMEGPARLDIGLEVLVPQFISPGDLIRVNTTNGEYMERV